MSSVFSTNIITQAGLRLIAEATAANPIVYVDACSSSQVPSNPENLNAYDGISGIIDASSATDNTARIVARYGNNTSRSAQMVKAIAITARLSSQQDSDKVIFAYCSDANSQIVFPPSSAPEQRTRFAFNLTFDGQGAVEVVDAGCAALSDLERLVSCHRAGNPNVGDDQQIHGNKTFLDETVFSDTVVHRNTVYLDADILPGQATTYSIGNNVGNRLSDVYTKTLHVGTLIGGNTIQSNWNLELGNVMVPEMSTITDWVSTVGLGTSNARFSSVYAKKLNGMEVEIRSEDTGVAGEVSLMYGENALMVDKDIVPAHTGRDAQSCGRISRPWKELYVSESIRLTNDTGEFLIYEDDGSIEFFNKYTSGGSQGEFFFDKIVQGGHTERATVHCGEIYGANLTISRSSISPIPQSEVIPDVYEGDVVTIPVGGLILVSPDRTWMRNGGKGRQIKPGEVIEITPSNKDAFFIADWNVDASSGSKYTGKALDAMNTYAYLKVGTYRALSYITYPANSQAPTYGAPILLQRIS